MKNQSKNILFLILLVVIAAFLEFLTLAVFVPIVISKAMNESIKLPELNFIGDIISDLSLDELVLITIFMIVLRTIYFLFFYKMRAQIVYSYFHLLTMQLISHLVNQPREILKKYGEADFVRRIHNELLNTASYVVFPALVIISEIVIILVLVSFLIKSFGFFIILIFLFPLSTMLLVTYYTSRQLKIISKLRLKWDQQKCIQIEETLKVAQQLQSNNSQIWWLSRIEKAAKLSFSAWIRYNETIQRPKLLIETLTILTIVTLFSFESTIDFLNSSVSLYSISAFVLIIMKILPSLNRISQSIGNVQFGQSIAAETVEFIKSNQLKNSKKKDMNTRVTINDLDGNNLLNVNKSGLIFLTGKSGSGKSLLLRDIAGIEDNPSFMVISETRLGLAYCPQDDFIFDGLLIENLFLGRAVSQDDLQHFEAIKVLLKLDFESLGVKNLHTDIGKLKVKWSGGQKRRLTITRTLLSNSDIYLFDEPFNGLQDELSINLIEYIKNLAKTKIVIITSHTFVQQLKKESSACLEL